MSVRFWDTCSLEGVVSGVRVLSSKVEFPSSMQEALAAGRRGGREWHGAGSGNPQILWEQGAHIDFLAGMHLSCLMCAS